MGKRSLNRVELIGTLGRDAELKFTPGGTAITKFSIATNRRWKDKNSNEWKEETDWHNIILWSSEKLSEYLTKGKQVYVEGRLQTRNYEKDGHKVYVTEVVAEDVILLGGKDDGKPRSSGSSSRPAEQSSSSGDSDAWGSGFADDDIPF